MAWHHYAQVSKRAGVSANTSLTLADALFTYIEEGTAHCIRGYTKLQLQTNDDIERKRGRLLELLLADPQTASREQIVELARKARWNLPETVICIALDEPWHEKNLLSPAVGPDALMDLERPDSCVLLPGTDRPDRDAMIRAFGEARISIGPIVPIADAYLSLRLARQALSLARRGIIIDAYPLGCEEHLATLLLLQDERGMGLLINKSMAHFVDFNATIQKRLTETLYSWLATGGRVPEMSKQLRLHPQTIRYRMRQLEEALGEMQDPTWRLHMMLALHSWQLLISQ